MRQIILILFLLSISLVIAQTYTTSESELKVRFTSLGGNTTVNLTRFLGQGIYNHTPVSNIQISITDGIANLVANTGWRGAEEITFYIQKEENESKPIFSIPKEILIPKEEVQALLSDRYNESYYQIIKDIDPEQIRELITKYEKDHLEITINKEVEITINTESSRPKVVMNILALTDTVAKPSPETFQFNPLILVKIILAILIFIILYHSKNYFVRLIRKIKRKKRKELLKINLLSKLNKISLNDKDSLKKLKYFLYEFYIRLFGITRDSTDFELETTLNKLSITGYIKQEILVLFENIEELKKENIKETIKTLRYIIKSL